MGLFDWHRLWAEPERDPLPIYDEESAIRYVRTLGYTVIKTKMPSNPGIGTCWSPRRRLTGDREPTVIKLTTWHDWVRKTRAVQMVEF